MGGSRLTGKIIVAGKYDQARAQKVVADGYVDIVCFGRPFIVNPDLPRRFRNGLPLAGFDKDTLFGGSEQGYSTYPDGRVRHDCDTEAILVSQALDHQSSHQRKTLMRAIGYQQP